VLMAALAGLGQLDREHAAVYFQIVYDALREPVRKALEAKIMERQTEARANFPPFLQQLLDGRFRDGKVEGARGMLLRLLARAGITLTEAERARIQAGDDAEVLDRWGERVLGAKTAADVLS
jgi:hypothetical protein